MYSEQGIFKMRAWDIEARVITDDEYWLMDMGGLDSRLGFDSIGMQSDGTPIVTDKCGNFGYLDSSKVKIIISFEP